MVSHMPQASNQTNDSLYHCSELSSVKICGWGWEGVGDRKVLGALLWDTPNHYSFHNKMFSLCTQM